jgi:hypothetical protein
MILRVEETYGPIRPSDINTDAWFNKASTTQLHTEKLNVSCYRGFVVSRPIGNQIPCFTKNHGWLT